MMSKDKICPILSLTMKSDDREFGCVCLTEDCAWWNAGAKKCAIALMPVAIAAAAGFTAKEAGQE